MQDKESPFTICFLKQEDAPEVAALEAACFSTPWGEEQYRKILLPDTEEAVPSLLPATPVWGMRGPAGELAAYAALGVYRTIAELEIYNIAVHHKFRRLGLGRSLLAHALEEARRSGVARALLEVRPSNTAALALYASLGFAICGSRRNYYKDSGEDALILTRDLTD